jgi:hypothetical protein
VNIFWILATLEKLNDSSIRISRFLPPFKK